MQFLREFSDESPTSDAVGQRRRHFGCYLSYDLADHSGAMMRTVSIEGAFVEELHHERVAMDTPYKRPHLHDSVIDGRFESWTGATPS